MLNGITTLRLQRRHLISTPSGTRRASRLPQWQRMAALSFVGTAFGSLRSGSRIYATAFLRSTAIHSEVTINTQNKRPCAASVSMVG